MHFFVASYREILNTLMIPPDLDDPHHKTDLASCRR